VEDELAARRKQTSVHDFVGLVFCDTRRVRGWKRALAQRGIEVRVTETFGEESQNGAYKISVPRKQQVAANELVTAVTRGEVALAGPGLTPMVVITAVLIAALVFALLQR
jgi:hypothetical protein